ncbi:hypothetical protein AVEN_222173-1 [Araneus ventricosus]|uniref:Uncharacterized protein n=1 Tax=Araneus ventricosus TaxID=182803 RepID=A0A4Y2FQ05_ARAVE|nr:hypothetical protein AVEN_222173-1 [Araneus ventricosus]
MNRTGTAPGVLQLRLEFECELSSSQIDENDVGHDTPSSGTGSDIAKCILKYLEDNDVDINELESIGFKGRSRFAEPEPYNFEEFLNGLNSGIPLSEFPKHNYMKNFVVDNIHSGKCAEFGFELMTFQLRVFRYDCRSFA